MKSTPRRIAVFLVLVATSTSAALAQDTSFIQSGPTADERVADNAEGVDAAASEGMYPPFKLSAGWYCTRYTSFFNQDGERVEFGGREYNEMFSLGLSYRLLETQIADRRTTVRAEGRLLANLTGFSDDLSDQSDSEFGLQNFVIGAGARMKLSQSTSASLRLRYLFDIAPEPENFLNVSDQSNSFTISAGLSHRFGSGLRTGIEFYHANRTEEFYPSTNAIVAQGSYPVLDTKSLKLKLGANLAYLSDTNDGGNMIAAGGSARLSLKNKPLSFKLDGGYTEDLIPTGNYALTGESYFAPRSFSLSVGYRF